MVVLVVNVDGVATIKRERHSPIPAHFHGPSASTFSLQGMQAQAWQSHVARFDRYMEAAQYEP